ncbi:MAG: N-acetylmuramoyl-L-alanine amidase, partial [Proteobacteria bacterium]|nr:N-acetylmuramoyl-L-alanine amidase [Pseudomonadota bacterium]
PSPNFNDRPASINMLIIHYTDMPTAEEAMSKLCDPAAQVSSHYTIDEDGTIYRHVPEEKRAWHAGLSFWRNRSNTNDVSIGIEMVNPGHTCGYRPFKEKQMEALIALSHGILKRHVIPARNVVAHSDVAPARKKDPGELFDWEWLADEGIGLWPEVAEDIKFLPILKKGDKSDAVMEMQRALASYGYDIKVDGNFHDQTEWVVRAFQRHFGGVGSMIDGMWNTHLDAALKNLLAQVS